MTKIIASILTLKQQMLWSISPLGIVTWRPWHDMLERFAVVLQIQTSKIFWKCLLPLLD